MALQFKFPIAAAAGIACLGISGSILMHAVTEWPARYRLHSLSWSISIYFVIFVTLSVLGPIVAWLSFRARNPRAIYWALGMPVLWFGLGAMIGVLKLLVTRDL